eukprot:1470262-Alexandrium_andersonii.AAC.1
MRLKELEWRVAAFSAPYARRAPGCHVASAGGCDLRGRQRDDLGPLEIADPLPRLRGRWRG